MLPAGETKGAGETKVEGTRVIIRLQTTPVPFPITQAIGRIQLLRELLGDTIATEESLRLVSSDEHTSTVQELQSKLRERNA